jgi:DNA repair protein RecN (Recombination protein N)
MVAFACANVDKIDMLQSLHLTDFVLVAEATLDLESGFTALTGETGAGKSILVDAIALALGGRGDSGVVRQGAAKTQITATFSVPKAAQTWLAEHEIDADDTLILRRVLDAQGKSKGFINGVPVPVAQLREVGDFLVDIHGQHAHQLLLKPAAQRSLLDNFGSHDTQPVAAAYRNLREAQQLLEAAQSGAKALQLEREKLAWQLDELDKLAPKAGEWAQIEAEHKRLAHSAALMKAAGDAVTALTERDHSLTAELDELHHDLSVQLAVDARLKDVVQALDDARIQAKEAAHMLASYVERADLDPQRLQEVEARLSALHGTARKLRMPPEELPQLWEQTSTRLKSLDAASDVDALAKRVQEAQAVYEAAAAQLTKARKATAKKLTKSVTEAMQSLAMSGGKFEASIQSAEPSSAGSDAVEFLVAAHAGVEPRPLAKVASGGELSRISLAISVIASTASSTPTLIFDEVDSGVGGAVAETVGRLMRELGKRCQVLAVTHLPQVASCAHHQWRVEKITQSGKTSTAIKPLPAKDRTEEIARMLGGQSITDTTRKHAKEMLRLAAV